MNNQVQTSQQDAVKNFMAQPATQKRVVELLGDRSSQFMTSISSMIGADDKLARCEPISLFMACLTAAALDLPINKNLAFAHIIPYENRRAGVTEAQFQMGWKGYVQLAQRTGKYKTIAATAVYEGQLVEEDPLEGNTYDWKAKSSDKVIGYVAKFTTVNGFSKEVYMSLPEIEAHAKKYSQAYKSNYGPWKDNFDAMAIKTVIKQLISKWGIMSVELQKAVESDSAVLKEDGSPEYIDGEGAMLDGEKATDDKKAAIIAANTQDGEVVEDPKTEEPAEDPGAVADDILNATEPEPKKSVKDKAAEFVAKGKAANAKKKEESEKGTQGSLIDNDNNSRSNPGER